MFEMCRAIRMSRYPPNEWPPRFRSSSKMYVTAAPVPTF
jgi:hypothetical protein